MTPRRATRSTEATVMQETTDDDRTGSDDRETKTRSGRRVVKPARYRDLAASQNGQLPNRAEAVEQVTRGTGRVTRDPPFDTFTDELLVDILGFVLNHEPQ